MTQEEGFTAVNQVFILAVPSVILTILCAWIVKSYFHSKNQDNANTELQENNQGKKKNKNSGSLTDSRSKQPTGIEKAQSSSAQNKKKQQQGARGAAANTKNNAQSSAGNQKTFSHRWLNTGLKTHTDIVLDFDYNSNSKYIASVAEDRTLLLWHVKDFHEKNHRVARTNIELDYGTKVRWSPDSKALVLNRAMDKSLEVYKVTKLADGNLGKAVPAVIFPQHHKGELVGLGIASNGKFIMTCSSDTKLVIWSIKGEILTSIDTRQVDVYHADVSPCGRFVASSGFTSDVKVWQVVFDKTGVFKELSKAFELKGHSAGVESFAFNSDSSRMVSLSKDKTWKFWDTNVEFEKGQEPHLLFSVNVLLQGPAKIVLSLDARVVAVITGSTLRVFSTLNGKEECKIENDGQIKHVAFDPIGNYVVVAVGKHIRVFHNVVGHRVIIQELEEQRKNKSISQSMKQRMQQQIEKAKAALEVIGES